MKRNQPIDFKAARLLQALAIGQNIKKVWREHPNFHFISNEGGWTKKEDTALQLIKLLLNENKTAGET